VEKQVPNVFDLRVKLAEPTNFLGPSISEKFVHNWDLTGRQLKAIGQFRWRAKNFVPETIRSLETAAAEELFILLTGTSCLRMSITNSEVIAAIGLLPL
jgi:hypothetical protein